MPQEKRKSVKIDTKKVEKISVEDHRPTRVHKYVLTVWCLLENVLFGGFTFGWALLVILLIDEGIYSELCSDADSLNQTQITSNYSAPSGHRVCLQQEQQLNLVFTVAVVLRAMSGPFIGQMLYQFGIRITRIFMVIVLSGGFLMLAFASRDIPGLLFPGLAFIAIGGEAVFSSNMQAAYLFTAGSSFVASLLSGMFDASAAVMLLIKLLNSVGVYRKYSFLGMVGILVLLSSVSTICLSPKTFFQDKNEKRSTRRRLSVGQTFFTMEDEIPPNSSVSSTSCQPNPLPSLKDCVMSRVFLSHMLWFSVLQLRWYFYLGAFNNWITTLTENDQEKVDFYTDVSLYIQMSSIVMSIVSGVGLGIDRRRNSEKLTPEERRLGPSVIIQGIACVIAIVLSGVILVESTNIVLLVFVLAICLRTLIYGMGAAYIQMIFPVQYFGFLFGVLMLVGGVIGCFQYLLFVWLELAPVGVQKVNILLLVLTFLSLIHPIHILITCRRAARRQRESKQINGEYSFIKISTNSPNTE